MRLLTVRRPVTIINNDIFVVSSWAFSPCRHPLKSVVNVSAAAVAVTATATIRTVCVQLIFRRLCTMLYMERVSRVEHVSPSRSNLLILEHHFFVLDFRGEIEFSVRWMQSMRKCVSFCAAYLNICHEHEERTIKPNEWLQYSDVATTKTIVIWWQTRAHAHSNTMCCWHAIAKQIPISAIINLNSRAHWMDEMDRQWRKNHSINLNLYI